MLGWFISLVVALVICFLGLAGCFFFMEKQDKEVPVIWILLGFWVCWILFTFLVHTVIG